MRERTGRRRRRPDDSRAKKRHDVRWLAWGFDFFAFTVLVSVGECETSGMKRSSTFFFLSGIKLAKYFYLNYSQEKQQRD
jgi:hypothetical protein